MATTTGQFTAHTNTGSVEAQRRRELGHIHQGAKALKWSEDDYRFYLRHATGADTAAKLDAAGRRKMLAFMETLGYQPASKFKPFGQAEKIAWLWKKLGEHGALRDTSPAALLAFVGRTTGSGVSDVSFLPTVEASKVIEALKAMLNRTL